MLLRDFFIKKMSNYGLNKVVEAINIRGLEKKIKKLPTFT